MTSYCSRKDDCGGRTLDSIEEQKRTDNPLGWTGLVLAVIGLIAFLVTFGWIEQIQRDARRACFPRSRQRARIRPRT